MRISISAEIYEARLTGTPNLVLVAEIDGEEVKREQIIYFDDVKAYMITMTEDVFEEFFPADDEE